MESSEKNSTATASSSPSPNAATGEDNEQKNSSSPSCLQNAETADDTAEKTSSLAPSLPPQLESFSEVATNSDPAQETEETTALPNLNTVQGFSEAIGEQLTATEVLPGSCVIDSVVDKSPSVTQHSEENIGPEISELNLGEVPFATLAHDLTPFSPPVPPSDAQEPPSSGSLLTKLSQGRIESVERVVHDTADAIPGPSSRMLAPNSNINLDKNASSPTAKSSSSMAPTDSKEMSRISASSTSSTTQTSSSSSTAITATPPEPIHSRETDDEFPLPNSPTRKEKESDESFAARTTATYSDKWRRKRRAKSVRKSGINTKPISSSWVNDYDDAEEEDERNVVGKYVYTAKFVNKPTTRGQNQFALRMRLAGRDSEGNADPVRIKKYYDTRRPKSDEIILLHRASNMIIAIFAATRKCLQVSLESLTTPVATYLETNVQPAEAWIGVIAEALRLVSTEYLLYESAIHINKKREMSQARQVMGTKLKESSERMSHFHRLVEDLERELRACDRTVESVCTGSRSRFYQSVWQTDVRLRQNGGGDTDWSLTQDVIMDADCSSSLSTSSLMSLHLLTPYVRWDMDGISVKKQVAKSWPLIKFSALSFTDKIEGVREILDGFKSFLEIPIQHIENALSALQETSHKSNSDGPKDELTLLDLQFRNILDALISERYFHPEEQQKGLIYAKRVKENFKLLQMVAEDVRVNANNFRDAWRRIFKNGDMSMSAAMLAVDSTSVPLWKSCKDFNFQLDLLPETSAASRASSKFTNLRAKVTLEQSSELPTYKQPKVLIPNFYQALREHLELFEDFDDSYEQRLIEMKKRNELIIFEEDIWHCTDLAQQLFFHFERIGNTLRNFSKELVHINNYMFSTVPTDPPMGPTSLPRLSPWRRILPKESNLELVNEESLDNLTGWMAAVLEIFHSTDTATFLRLRGIQSLEEKCQRLIKSLITLEELLDVCLKNYRRTEKSMERILNHVEKYFKMLEDNLKVMSRVSSTKAMPVIDEQQHEKNSGKQPEEPPPPTDTPDDKTLNDLLKSHEGEVSIFVTVNGIYFNQFGVVFSTRLDATSFEHRLRIAEHFLSHILEILEGAKETAKSIVKKFGATNTSGFWWQQLKKPPTLDASMLIDGDLEQHVYNKSIFHLFQNIEAAFTNLQVKANLEIYSELEAIILIRTTRILEEEVVRFGHACKDMQQKLANLQGFRKYFKKGCNRFFNNGKIVSPFEKWNHQISCYKLVIQTESLKCELDKVLTSSASENASRSGSDHNMSSSKLFRRSKPPGSTASVLDILQEQQKKWQQQEEHHRAIVIERNAYLTETETTASRLIELDFETKSPEKSYIGQTEATSVIIAHAVMHLRMETMPKHLKYSVVKKLQALSTKLQECRAIISHSINTSRDRSSKVTEKLRNVISTYSRIHSSSTYPASQLESTNVPETPLPTTKDSTREYDEQKRSRQMSWNTNENESEDPGGEDVSDLDVFITLHFPYESLILSYRGYERTTSFRSWSVRPSDQAAVLDILSQSISDQLTKLVEGARKVSHDYAQLNRGVVKLLNKFDQALPLPVSTITAFTDGLKEFREHIHKNKLISLLETANNDLDVILSRLKLAIAFCEKHIEITKESNFSTSDFTVTVRNPFEKAIREIFTKPIRITIPYDKFDVKLW